jgi:hypothetical protein
MLIDGSQGRSCSERMGDIILDTRKLTEFKGAPPPMRLGGLRLQPWPACLASPRNTLYLHLAHIQGRWAATFSNLSASFVFVEEGRRVDMLDFDFFDIDDFYLEQKMRPPNTSRAQTSTCGRNFYRTGLTLIRDQGVSVH